MKLNLKKSQLVNLSLDNQALPNELTPQIAGGNCTCGCCPTPTTPAAGCPGGGGNFTEDPEVPRCGTMMTNPPPGYYCF